MLTTSELDVGIIAYFCIDALRADPQVRHSGGSADSKPRPFVCYAVSGDASFWSPLTLSRRANQNEVRLLIEKHWIANPLGNFARAAILLNDGGHCYSGPNARFVSLSRARDRLIPERRPRILPEGVVAILARVQAEGGLLPAGPA